VYFLIIRISFYWKFLVGFDFSIESAPACFAW
jgi:hypothetical protein